MTINNNDKGAVKDYFSGRSIFITGVTGFLGKVLLEKILRVCDGVVTIYVLIRPRASRTPGKPEISAKERLEKLLETSIFQKLRSESPSLFAKVVAVSGDISWENLGISQSAESTICDNVSVIFHLAATVKFNESLATVMNVNVGGTMRVINLAKKLTNLSSMVYVSTAFSNADLYDIQIEEVVYPSPCDPAAFLDTASWLEKIGVLEDITPAVIGDKPNTYIFSKHMAENLVQREALECGIPVCIVRPSIVSPIHHDPIELEGWVDNLLGFSGFLYAIGHGLNYISIGDKTVNLDLIPVDYVVNILMLAAWNLGSFKPEVVNGVMVYNACVDQFNPISNETVGKHGSRGNKLSPFRQTIRPPSLKLTQNRFLYSTLNFVAVGLPCVLADGLAYLTCRRPGMYQKYLNVHKAFSALAYFRTRNFRFVSNNVEAVRSTLLEDDKKDFGVDIESIDWEDYVHKCLIGLRRYYDKEDDSTLPQARKNASRMKGIYWTILAGLLLLFIFLVTFAVITSMGVKFF